MLNLLSLTALLALPTLAYAFPVSSTSVAVMCGIIPCNSGGGGAMGLSGYVLERVVAALEIGVIAAAVICLFIAAVQMVMFAHDETTVKDSRMSYIYIITGLSIVGLARLGVLAFSAPNTGTELVNVAVAEQGIGNVVTYFKLIIAISLTVNIVLQAVRLISSQGAQEQVDKAKKRLIAGFIGAGIILIANILIVSTIPGTGGSVEIAGQIAGIASYLITIVGFLALLGIIVAGVLLIVSIDEALKEKAKTIIKTSIIALIIVLLSYAFVTAFITLT